MDKIALRAWWWRRQGLDGSLSGAPAAEVLTRTGWARSVGGAAPYLTLFARAGIGRQAVDAALDRLEIHELPAARGCTYVVPAADYALALRAGQGFGEAAEIKTAQKLGVPEAEIDKLCTAIIDALGRGPLSVDALRQAAGGAVRSLGPEGTKKGLSTTLPVGLGKLQSVGEIRRIPVNGRLDQQRYHYALWRPNPLSGVHLSNNEAHVELARRFFRWIAPASLSELQWFSGLGARAARAAVKPLDLVPSPGDNTRSLFPEDLEALQSLRVPRQPHYSLVSSLDGISHLRRDVAGLLDDQDLNQPVFTGGSGGLVDLPSHAIIDRGRLAGLWQYHPDSSSIAWMSFVPKSKALKDAVERTEAFVRGELGDARAFSLDTPTSRKRRIEAIRAAS